MRFTTKIELTSDKTSQPTGGTVIYSGSTLYAQPINYTSNLSGSYTKRSLVDKSYVTGLTGGFLSTSSFNTYSASTLTNINSRLLTSVFNTYTGTTASGTYLKISNFNPYSASTLTNIQSRLLTSSFNTYSASTLTNIQSRLLTSSFNIYTGTTAPATYQSKSSIATLTGTTLPATYQKINTVQTQSVNIAPTARYSGSFQITGTSFSTGIPVLVMQTAVPYTNKGNLADESEMDIVTVSGYVLNSTTIQCYWNCKNLVLGYFTFQYMIGN